MGNLKNDIYDVKKSFETLKPLKFNLVKVKEIIKFDSAFSETEIL